MKKSGNLIFCGVGGQGILLASEITARAMLNSGFDVKNSEVHGMAQRGGLVIAHLRYGEKVFSPLIEPGTVDIQIAFEMLEALRYLSYLNRDSKVIVNIQRIPPSPVSSGREKYPEDIIGELEKRGLSVFPVDAFEIGKSLGETRASNLALVGALSMLLPVEEESFIGAITSRAPEKFLDVNIKAFQKGREAIEKMHVA
jgi:indolepyruvate ferredoxin oxidoreductase beta subunit